MTMTHASIDAPVITASVPLLEPPGWALAERQLFDLLGAEAAGVGLTESYAMTHGSAVSGLIFANAASRYFTVGRIGRDQAADYAARRGVPLAEVERWLRPNLGYEPE